MNENYPINWYDQPKYILEKLKTLEGFHELIKARHYAHYEEKENLNEFYIFGGQWKADNCGNMMKLVTFIPADYINTLPKLMTSDYFFKKIHEYDLSLHPDVLSREEISKKDFNYKTNKRPFPMSIAYSFDPEIPRPDLICPVCKKGWTISNCFDSHKEPEVKTMNMSLYIGYTIEQIKEDWSNLHTAIWSVTNDIFLRNDKYIDLTPDPKYPTLKINEYGWVDNRKGNKIIADTSHVIEKGDEISFEVTTYYHKKCYQNFVNSWSIKKFVECFNRSNMLWFSVVPIKNEYESQSWRGPWYQIDTEFGMFTVGWRKNVIQLIWPDGSDYDVLFKSENTTKWKEGIHAWGYDKLTEYLKKIKES